MERYMQEGGFGCLLDVLGLRKSHNVHSFVQSYWCDKIVDTFVQKQYWTGSRNLSSWLFLWIGIIHPTYQGCLLVLCSIVSIYLYEFSPICFFSNLINFLILDTVKFQDVVFTDFVWVEIFLSLYLIPSCYLALIKVCESNRGSKYQYSVYPRYPTNSLCCHSWPP